MEIRRIRFNEAEVVARMYTVEYAPGAELDCIVPWLQNCAVHPRAFCLVAQDGGEIAGFVIASETRSEVMPGHAGELEELYARPEHRGDDVRRQLAEAALAALARRGAGVVHVGIDHDEPEEARDFWRRLGFEHHVDRFTLYPDDGGTMAG